MELASPHPSSQITQHVLSHMINRLSAVDPSDDPYPHISIRDIFPQDVYADLIDLLPDESVYTTMGKRHIMENGESNRFEFQLSAENIDENLTGQRHNLWTGIRNALNAPELKKAVFNRLSAGIGYRFGLDPQDVNQVEAFPRLSLMREKPGYFITPHPDTRKKLVTFQIALPRDRSQLDLGTMIYKRNLSPKFLLNRPKGFRGFEKVKQYPFEPNSAFAFSVINTVRKKSWHGREALEGESGIRNSLLCIYYASKENATTY